MRSYIRQTFLILGIFLSFTGYSHAQDVPNKVATCVDCNLEIRAFRVSEIALRAATTMRIVAENLLRASPPNLRATRQQELDAAILVEQRFQALHDQAKQALHDCIRLIIEEQGIGCYPDEYIIEIIEQLTSKAE